MSLVAMDRRRMEGCLLALVTAAASAGGFHLAAPALRHLRPLEFGCVEFAFATLLCFAWLAVRREWGAVRAFTGRAWGGIAVQAALSVGALLCLWRGLTLIPPTQASLFNRVEVLVAVALGMLFLGERLRPLELVGGGLMLGGVLILRSQAPPALTTGSWWVLASAGFFGASEAWAKAQMRLLPPVPFAAFRNLMVLAAFWGIALGLALAAPAAGPVIDWPAIARWWPNLLGTAVCAAFLARTLYFYALQRIDISKAALINQTQPLFVALLAAILYGTRPGAREWVGGLGIVGGGGLLVWAATRARAPRA